MFSNSFLETSLLSYLNLFYACFVGFNFSAYTIAIQSFRKLNLPLFFCIIVRFRYSQFIKWMEKQSEKYPQFKLFLGSQHLPAT